MATAMPTPGVQLEADQAIVGPVLVQTPAVTEIETDRHRSDIITGRELVLVPSLTDAPGVRLARVVFEDARSVASQLDVACTAPILASPRPTSAPRTGAPGQSRCGCWQSLRLLGSARRHDHDHLTGGSSARGCPACGRGLPAGPVI
jgi:hypothetical protein